MSVMIRMTVRMWPLILRDGLSMPVIVGVSSARDLLGEIWQAEAENQLKRFRHRQICALFWPGSGPKHSGGW